MRISVKLPLTFCALFALAFSILILFAHENLRQTITSAGLAPEFADVVVSGTETYVLIIAGIIGALSIFAVILIAGTITDPVSKLSKICRTQDVMNLRTIEIKRGVFEKKDEIDDVIQSVNVMINRLRELDVKKSEFASMVSHELKTPLLPILGFCDTIKDPKIMGQLSPDQVSVIDAIQRNAKRLQILIENILDAQQLAGNIMKFETQLVDVAELMNSVQTKFFHMIEEKKIEFVNLTTEKLFVETDKKRIQQVLANLILNATDFVPSQGGRIEICAKDNGKKEVLFYVKDNGIGIAKEKQQELFSKFYQVEKLSTRRHEGVGLGLAICKGIVETLGGKIWVESDIGKGSAFYFTLKKELKNQEGLLANIN